MTTRDTSPAVDAAAENIAKTLWCEQSAAACTAADGTIQAALGSAAPLTNLTAQQGCYWRKPTGGMQRKP
jgi:hypothetical protein